MARAGITAQPRPHSLRFFARLDTDPAPFPIHEHALAAGSCAGVRLDACIPIKLPTLSRARPTVHRLWQSETAVSADGPPTSHNCLSATGYLQLPHPMTHRRRATGGSDRAAQTNQCVPACERPATAATREFSHKQKCRDRSVQIPSSPGENCQKTSTETAHTAE